MMEKTAKILVPLLHNIREHVSISDEQLKLFLDAFTLKTLAKKEILLFEGDVSNHMRFVADGCLRSYYLDDNAVEHIIQFGIRGWWINDLYSYLTKEPATCFIQAVQPSTVLQIHRDHLERIYDLVPPIERFYRIKFQNAYVALQQRTLERMSLTAKERYRNFITQYRDIEQRVPQYMIASYLNVTPEFLSALRSKG
jgi:CRP-like cAMP-binding protein